LILELSDKNLTIEDLKKYLANEFDLIYNKYNQEQDETIKLGKEFYGYEYLQYDKNKFSIDLDIFEDYNQLIYNLQDSNILLKKENDNYNKMR
jgi:hypothetical protein